MSTEFENGLALLVRVDPRNVMIPIISRGDNVCNRLYLDTELKKYNLQDILHPEDLDVYIDNEPIDDAENPLLKQKYTEMDRLYNKMRKISNEFHVCTTDKTRAAVSRRIESIMKQIQKLRQEMSYIHKFGIEKEQPDSSEYPIPKDKWAIQMSLNTKGPAISRQKRLIKQENNSEDPDDARLLKLETKLQKLELHKIYLEKAIKNI